MLSFKVFEKFLSEQGYKEIKFMTYDKENKNLEIVCSLSEFPEQHNDYFKVYFTSENIPYSLNINNELCRTKCVYSKSEYQNISEQWMGFLNKYFPERHNRIRLKDWNRRLALINRELEKVEERRKGLEQREHSLNFQKDILIKSINELKNKNRTI